MKNKLFTVSAIFLGYFNNVICMSNKEESSFSDESVNQAIIAVVPADSSASNSLDKPSTSEAKTSGLSVSRIFNETIRKPSCSDMDIIKNFSYFFDDSGNMINGTGLNPQQSALVRLKYGIAIIRQKLSSSMTAIKILEYFFDSEGNFIKQDLLSRQDEALARLEYGIAIHKHKEEILHGPSFPKKKLQTYIHSEAEIVTKVLGYFFNTSEGQNIFDFLSVPQKYMAKFEYLCSITDSKAPAAKELLEYYLFSPKGQTEASAGFSLKQQALIRFNYVYLMKKSKDYKCIINVLDYFFNTPKGRKMFSVLSPAQQQKTRTAYGQAKIDLKRQQSLSTDTYSSPANFSDGKTSFSLYIPEKTLPESKVLSSTTYSTPSPEEAPKTAENSADTSNQPSAKQEESSAAKTVEPPQYFAEVSNIVPLVPTTNPTPSVPNISYPPYPTSNSFYIPMPLKSNAPSFISNDFANRVIPLVPVLETSDSFPPASPAQVSDSYSAMRPKLPVKKEIVPFVPSRFAASQTSSPDQTVSQSPTSPKNDAILPPTGLSKLQEETLPHDSLLSPFGLQPKDTAKISDDSHSPQDFKTPASSFLSSYSFDYDSGIFSEHQTESTQLSAVEPQINSCPVPLIPISTLPSLSIPSLDGNHISELCHSDSQIRQSPEFRHYPILPAAEKSLACTSPVFQPQENRTLISPILFRNECKSPDFSLSSGFSTTASPSFSTFEHLVSLPTLQITPSISPIFSHSTQSTETQTDETSSDLSKKMQEKDQIIADLRKKLKKQNKKIRYLELHLINKAKISKNKKKKSKK